MGVGVDGVSPKALMEVNGGPEQPVLSKLPEFAVGHVSHCGRATHPPETVPGA